MNKWSFLVVALSLGFTSNVKAVVAHTPAPSYPNAAHSAKIQGSGICQVQFDGAGHVATAKMTKSTGSKILDDNTVAFAQKNWTGEPNSTASVPITYVLQNQPGSSAVQTPPASSIREHFSAVCQVTIDAAGHDAAVMTTSSGSKTLDDHLMQVAPKYFNGLGLRQFSIDTLCYGVEVDTAQGKMKVVVVAPSPAYPYQARASHAQGSGVVTASFDRSGQVTNVVMTRSTHSKILDENTVNYARALWRSAGGEKVTLNVPITYRLR